MPPIEFAHCVSCSGVTFQSVAMIQGPEHSEIHTSMRESNSQYRADSPSPVNMYAPSTASPPRAQLQI